MLEYLQIEMFCFAALGAFALWMRLKYGPDLLRGVEHFVDEVVDDFRIRVLVQIGIFVTLGAIISVMLIEPGTKRQAFAAGTACAAFFGTLATAGTRKGRANAGS